MTVASRGRQAGGVLARLACVVLLAAAVSAVLEGVLAAHLASQAVLREARARVGADAGMLAGVSSAEDPWAAVSEALDDVTARPDVLAAWLVDSAGTVRRSGAAGAAGAADPGAWDGRTLDAASQEVVEAVITDGTPRIAPLHPATGPAGADPRSGALSLVVPVQVAGEQMALLEALDPGPPARRAADLRHALLLVIALGGAATVPMALAFGGRRLAAGYRRVARAAGTDDLTRLGNRRALHAELAGAVAEARRSGRPLSVALLEVGGLDAVRDATGRRRADALLVGVAGVLARGREGDLAFRVGGDGFAVVMPGTPTGDAAEAAEALCRRIAEQTGPLTATAGVCTLDDRCPDVETLLIGADAALLEAKHRAAGSGRALPGAVPVPSGRGLSEPDEEVWDIRLLIDGDPTHG